MPSVLAGGPLLVAVWALEIVTDAIPGFGHVLKHDAMRVDAGPLCQLAAFQCFEIGFLG